MKYAFLFFVLVLFSSLDGLGYTLIFETEKHLIKTDTNSFYDLVRKNYRETRILEIKNEINYRSKKSDDGNVKMDGINLNLYLDEKRLSYEASCLRYNEIYKLIENNKAQIIYKNDLKEVSKIKIKKKGSKSKGEILKIYYDKRNKEVILKRVIYRIVCRGGPRWRNE
ncbi:hypothetical protein RCC89_19855 [Cytophagaceae bacterium ABcell3]|nr:hypothetical protein RCC89_19855 [Cytophagaceae bacterium ABcell3]